VDFTLEETQQAVARLAAEVLDQGRPGALPSPVPAARDADGYDPSLWKELGQSTRTAASSARPTSMA
jgi:hypothetical protein